MLNSFNRGITLSFLSIIILTSILLGCKKNVSESPNEINLPIVIHNSKVVDIVASDVITTSSYFKRKIEVVDSKKNIVKYTFIITVKSNEPNKDILSSLKDKSFKGYISVESENVELLKYESSEDGIMNKNLKSNNESSRIKITQVPNTCKLSLVHGCVDYKLSKMNIFAYGLCLYGAPECYAGLWAECSWIFCVTGNQNISEL